jgi:scyllo-inositol 2-dehydrogenase (NADP+)
MSEETMSVKDKIRFGIIGSGGIARRFALSMQHTENACVSAVWGRNEATVAALAEAGNAEVCLTLDALFDRCDAVYIATLPDTHEPFALAALEARKPVLCEKPLMRSSEELDRVLVAARENNQLFMEAMKPPFFPLHRSLREHLEKDPIGNVQYVQSGYCDARVSPDHPSWRADLHGGALQGIGVYQAWLAVEWLGPASSIATIGRMQNGVDAFAFVQVEHQRGFSQLHCGMGLSSPGEATLCAEGGHVSLHAPWWNPVRATIRYKDGRTVTLDEPFAGGGLQYEVDHFCQLLRTDTKMSPVLTHTISRDVMHILDAARAQVMASQLHRG